MRSVTRRGIVVLLAVVLGSAAGPAAAQRRSPKDCGGLHDLRVMDLGMVPDPVPHNGFVKSWSVRLRADGNGECATQITILAGVGARNHVAGSRVAFSLRPGLNVIGVPAPRGYRIRAPDTCFFVWADIQNTPTALDALRPFCARRVPGGWTLR
ncbi:MAG: hypothetical protein A3E31_08280 [Candidatus Rokubacteria bacterium RIFCSPHIGHO2_12_FULL_73_22]|nr:MAG: hypothetical protein A3D33_07785 [Candidatus Rokubacteria bacterium RIFCSPHIGHO2_02_FULL_73_26]OGL04015.1 MAG: hypothetical protein A3E31_08280 [Candidatus Rokubacteria bacterium RIFCSPHIGHO2_12_FULL_73_22]OGL09614.1 MAG: hypothetical protein A3I14_11035 [Candidatus Rokubacteria bacterium RIFCSPLOWO2_02_FULL_73_56]OGL27884.1 MAG: hypothetical protein A3G44_04445 [Candidatus Rokubacteria bacterium RIFCSPLOWO2_12_FULL_73_47]